MWRVCREGDGQYQQKGGAQRGSRQEHCPTLFHVSQIATGNVGGGLRYGSVRKRPYRSFGKDSDWLGKVSRVDRSTSTSRLLYPPLCERRDARARCTANTARRLPSA